MAKTYRNLFPAIYDFAALEAAYRLARRGKRDRPEVQRFEQNLEGELIQLQNELIWGTYRTSPYHFFTVHEPKERLVAALPFRDRVVQHALVAVIEPLWERRFVAHSYACRPGRGLHRAADQVQRGLRHLAQREGGQGRVYALKGDIAKYFPSIDHGILKALLRRHIACPRTLALCDAIIDAGYDGDDLAPCGLPIGNLTSQLWANVYLHELDKFVKHALRARHYARYMDDFVLLAADKASLHVARGQIETFLWERLRLRTNAKTQVFPIRRWRGRGLDFVGYRLWPGHRRLRRSSVWRMTRQLRRLRRWYRDGRVSAARVRQSIQSWVAHARHADTWGLRRQVL
jgi:retron-type reverse transcriptase